MCASSFHLDRPWMFDRFKTPGSEGVSLGAASFTCTFSYLSLKEALLRRTTCPLWTEAWPPNKSMLFSCVDMERRKQMWRNEVEVAILVPGCRPASLKLQPTLSRSHKLFWGFKSKFRPRDHVHSFPTSTVNRDMLCQVLRHVCFLHFHQCAHAKTPSPCFSENQKPIKISSRPFSSQLVVQLFKISGLQGRHSNKTTVLIYCSCHICLSKATRARPPEYNRYGRWETKNTKTKTV